MVSVFVFVPFLGTFPISHFVTLGSSVQLVRFTITTTLLSHLVLLNLEDFVDFQCDTRGDAAGASLENLEARLESESCFAICKALICSTLQSARCCKSKPCWKLEKSKYTFCHPLLSSDYNRFITIYQWFHVWEFLYALASLETTQVSQ